ncbi:Scr1 family TA system antitoxin-like transcriptional regulator [Saccharopolyspora sp. NFXS83]|uniref:Scr1 family TA system antitoxin-like transcriptional regulator n=1 Tax=Saccharopolyspora sp. NFXS83 TaxID=2993560 RepID=UPI00224B7019|nr:Scr1 family TA system antitoxin-like transcriptional regulator [Saccharopolyspora sp. NFXS83]MCX2731849.1 Scr1 family TA system antitoxin-like transcriptional regulator [Saccharopolyspora sp. NFXS83]
MLEVHGDDLGAVPDYREPAEEAELDVALVRVGGEFGEVDARVEFRLQRRELLTRQNPPWMWFVIGEAAIRGPLGGRDVLHQQLPHLVDMIERNPPPDRPSCTVGSSRSPAIRRRSGNPSVRRPPRRHLRQPAFIGGDVHLTEDRDARECARLSHRLRAVALGPDETRALIAERG